MGFCDCWDALNVRMPRRIPRTEYSTSMHYDLLAAVSGLSVTKDSPGELKGRANRALQEAWDFGFQWSTTIGGGDIKGRRTSMGHAEYAAAGADWNPHVHCPFETPEQVLDYDPLTEAGTYDHHELVARFRKAYLGACNGYHDAVNMAGVYTTMISGLIEVFGWDMLLLAAGVDPVGFGAVARRWERWVKQFFDAYADTDIPVMMVHDDMVWTAGPMIAPAWYREYIFPAFKRLWRPVLDAGKIIVFTSDGNYTEFFDDIVDCGARCLVMEPMCDMAAFARKYGRTHAFIGNADTRILLSGTKAAITAEVERCVAIGRDCPGFIMAVGNHIPPNTPVANALHYQEVFERLRMR